MAGSIFRNQCLLAPVHYDQSTHIHITDAVADATIHFFLQGWQAKHTTVSIEQWALSFLTAWVDDITYLAPAMKHSGFESECEWRIIHRLQPEDFDKMVFLQKKTLMSRHLPLTYKVAGTPDESSVVSHAKLYN
jgi:hypothetical protein